MRMQSKMRLILFASLVAFPLCLLVFTEYVEHGNLENAIAICIAVNLILLVPNAYLATNLLAAREIGRLNNACLEIKKGNLTPFGTVPVEPDDADELQLLKSNMFWMSHAIESRQIALNNVLRDLAHSRQQALESLDYASLIQKAFLPRLEVFEHVFSEHFLIWEQRDVVGGDSYWVRKTRDGFFAAVIDCTGHGVPGAFMTLIVQSLFEQVDADGLEGDPAAVLAFMNRGIKQALAQKGNASGSDDGMDCALCFIENEGGNVVFSGAGNSLFVRSADGAVSEIRGDRCGVGYVRSPEDFRFTNTGVEVEDGMLFYVVTDGFTDQIGGEGGLPFGKKRLMRLLSQTGDVSLAQQRTLLEQAFARYRGGEPCRDDRTVLGFSVTRRKKHAAKV